MLHYFLQSAKAIENNNFSSDSMLTLLSTLFSLVKFKICYDEIFQKVYGGRGHYRTFSKLRPKVNFQFKLLQQCHCVIGTRWSGRSEKLKWWNSAVFLNLERLWKDLTRYYWMIIRNDQIQRRKVKCISQCHFAHFLWKYKIFEFWNSK